MQLAHVVSETEIESLAARTKRLQRPQERTQAELQRLVAPHLGRLTEVAERILGSGEAADDAVQEALVTLWKAQAEPPNLQGWLVRTVVHRSLHARRTALRRRKWEERAGAEWVTTCPLCDPSEAGRGARAPAAAVACARRAVR